MVSFGSDEFSCRYIDEACEPYPWSRFLRDRLEEDFVAGRLSKQHAWAMASVLGEYHIAFQTAQRDEGPERGKGMRWGIGMAIEDLCNPYRDHPDYPPE